jgi:hypothetical protein
VPALVAVLAVAVVLLGVLVAGLLRSHAEILRKLHELGAVVGLDAEPDIRTAGEFTPQTGVPGPGGHVELAKDIAGVTPGDEVVVIGVVGSRHNTVVAFLSTGCLTCQEFWQAFEHPERLGLPDGTRVVIVTKSPEEESESGVRDLAPADIPVVMSTDAWDDYQIPGSPYFVHVDGPTGRVVGEGSATSWQQVVSLLTQATEDSRLSRKRKGRRTPAVEPASATRLGDRDRADLIDRELTSAGIRPGDSSLYPSAPVDEQDHAGHDHHHDHR